MIKNQKFLSKRTDISIFLTHLTRDTDWGNAKENLISIINELTIRAYSHYCLFSPILKNELPKIQNKFNVVCLTETPLNNISLLVDIPNRQIDLKPYGILFKKSTLVKEYGVNPVFYAYDEELLNYFKDQYNRYINEYKDRKKGTKTSSNYLKFYELGALINKVGENHDFHWEREWRIKGNLNFNITDIFSIIAPEHEHKSIKEAVIDEDIKKIPFIDIKWSIEEIVEQFAFQMWCIGE